MRSRSLSRPVVLALAAARMAADAWPGRRRVAPAAPRRILIAHHLLLGDTIMLTPLIAKCRARWPAAEIVMTCPAPLVGLYAGRPYGVHALRYDPREVATLGPLVSAAGFDLALVPGDNRLSWLARSLDARWIVAFEGDTPAYKNWPIDEFRRYPDTPTAWGDLVAGLVDGPPPPPYRASDWPAPDAAPFDAPATPYAVLHVGAGSQLRLWPAERWREIGRRLVAQGYAVVLSAGPGEHALLDPIDKASAWPRFPGTLTLAQLWRLIAGAAITVCPDTGVAHLARLTGTPTVALYGPGSAVLFGAGGFFAASPYTAVTIPDFPCRDQRIAMKREVAWIRDCKRVLGSGPGQCPEARCMLALSVDAVWQAIVDRIAAVA